MFSFLVTLTKDNSPFTFYLFFVILLAVMEKYELTILIEGKATPAKKKSVLEKIDKLLKVLEGKVTTKEDWGKKELAYRIKKNDTGNYLFFELELNPLHARSLHEKLNNDEAVLRYLLIRKD